MALATLTALSERGRESRRQKEEGKGELTATTGHGSFNPAPTSHPYHCTSCVPIRPHFLNSTFKKKSRGFKENKPIQRSSDKTIHRVHLAASSSPSPQPSSPPPQHFLFTLHLLSPGEHKELLLFSSFTDFPKTLTDSHCWRRK